MSKKVFLGLAVVGGGLYYYDQNIQPIFPREEAQRIANKTSKEALVVNKDLQKLDTKTREFGSQLKKTVSDLATEVKQKTDSALTSVKDSELYNKWSSKVEDYTKDVELAAEEVEQKPLFPRLAAKYVDFVNRIGQTDEEKLKELQSATSARQQEIKKELLDSRQSWSSWWSGKKSEVDSKASELENKAEKKKDSWVNWGSSKKDEAERELNKAKADAEKEKNLWVNWGSSKKEEAKDKLDQAKNDAEKEKNLWVNWGSSKKAEAEKELNKAKADAEKEKNSWTNWGSAKVDEADKQLQSASKDAQSTYEASKKAAVDEYNHAKKTLDDLTKQAADKANSLFGEAKKDLDNHLEKAKNDFNSAFTNLKKYGNDLVDLVSK